MTKRMSVKETREHLADVLGTVYYGKEPVIVEKKGKPMAVLISPEQFEQFEQFEREARERLAEVTAQLWRENADKDPEEVYRDITAVVEDVRLKRYEQQRG